MIHRRAAHLAASVIVGGLVFSSCSSGGQRRAATATPTSSGPAVANSVVPASPGAARISGLPQTPAPAGPGPAIESPESLLRRIVLFPTDLPAVMSGQPPVVESPAEVAQRARVPAAVLANSARWNQVASSRSAFEGGTAGPGPFAVRSGAILFADESGARAQMASLGAGDVDAILATIRLSGEDAPLAGVQADPIEPPSVGDGTLAWRLRVEGSGGAPAGTLVALRRGRVVGIVATIGGGDAVALARILDARAAAQLR